MMNNYEELIKTAQILRSISVTGDYWIPMQACVNSILQVAEAIKSKPNESKLKENADGSIDNGT